MASGARAKRALPVYVTLAELHRMLEACASERDRLLLKLLWHTGARISEVLSLRAGDLTRTGVRLPNRKQGLWRTGPDGSRQHVRLQAEKHVLLHPAFLAELRELTRGLPPQELLLRSTRGGPLSRSQAWRIIGSSAARAGVFKRRFGEDTERPLWPHCLRHGYAVNLLLQGTPITVVQEQLGHASLAATQVYTRLVDPKKQEIIAGLKF